MKEHTNPVLRTSPLESHPLSKSGRPTHVGNRWSHKIAARVKPDERLVSLVSPPRSRRSNIEPSD